MDLNLSFPNCNNEKGIPDVTNWNSSSSGMSPLPFMPSCVVGKLENCWPPNPPTIAPMLCESFPYNPQNYSYKWKQQNNNNATSYKRPNMREDTFIDFCDVCDRGFKTEMKRREHYNEHEKCSEPGCSFEAHYKLIEIHKRNAHGPNGFRINLTSPEEIEKWREERRKNFPTEKKKKEKLLQEANRRDSGAVLERETFGKRGRSRGGYSRGGKRGKYQNRSAPNFHRKHNSNEESTQSTPICSASERPLVTGDEDNGNSEQSSPTSLSQLISSYQSDEEQSGGESQSKFHKKQAVVSKNKFKSEEDKTLNGKEKRNFEHWREPRRFSRPSLLRKLLEPEIRRERNEILQCVRYIVKNNFFEPDRSPL